MLRTARFVSSLALIALLSISPAFAQASDTLRIGALRLSYVAQNSKTTRAALAQVKEFALKKSLVISEEVVKRLDAAK